VLRVLRSEQGGRFTLDEEANTLAEISSGALTGLADPFEAFFQEGVVAQYEAALSALASVDDSRLTGLAARISDGCWRPAARVRSAGRARRASR